MSCWQGPPSAPCEWGKRLLQHLSSTPFASLQLHPSGQRRRPDAGWQEAAWNITRSQARAVDRGGGADMRGGVEGVVNCRAWSSVSFPVCALDVRCSDQFVSEENLLIERTKRREQLPRSCLNRRSLCWWFHAAAAQATWKSNYHEWSSRHSLILYHKMSCRKCVCVYAAFTPSLTDGRTPEPCSPSQGQAARRPRRPRITLFASLLQLHPSDQVQRWSDGSDWFIFVIDSAPTLIIR